MEHIPKRPNEPIIIAEDLGHRFPPAPFLWRHLSFHVYAGEVVAVCGRSGCGKSTLLSIIAGWQTPFEGTCLHNGSRVNWVFQNPYRAAYRTALDIASYPLLCLGMNRSEAEREAHRTLDMFALAEREHNLFSELSGGEAQRLMLARAINARPDVLLVDEPTAQLDNSTSQLVNASLSHLACNGAAVLVATHDPQTRQACDRVINLNSYGAADGAINATSASGTTESR